MSYRLWNFGTWSSFSSLYLILGIIRKLENINRSRKLTYIYATAGLLYYKTMSVDSTYLYQDSFSPLGGGVDLPKGARPDCTPAAENSSFHHTPVSIHPPLDTSLSAGSFILSLTSCCISAATLQLLRYTTFRYANAKSSRLVRIISSADQTGYMWACQCNLLDLLVSVVPDLLCFLQGS